MNLWKTISLAGLMAAAVSAWSGPVQAQYYGGNIDGREAFQERQIQHGSRSGAITPQEAARLAAEQQRIRNTEARMRADGRLTYPERGRLDRMQANAGRHIYQQSHDNQVYPGYHNNHQPRSRYMQRRAYPHGNRYYGRPNGCDRRGAMGPHPGERGRYSRPQGRDRRLAWY